MITFLITKFIIFYVSVPGTSGQTSEDTIKLMKKALKEKQQTINEQSDRISQLEKKIIKLKQNEANENKALEDMIQQVEENLVKTTKRAVESERNVDKMKQDLKQLKAQVLDCLLLHD